MLTVSLPLLPPPASSLLPPLYDRPRPDHSNSNEAQNSLQAQQQQRRTARGQPNAMHSRSEHIMLHHEEKVLSQRKKAIQMYGYSWLKPAGCTKTMLGRKEEEIEREEVERQLREVELQERNAAEMEEAERQAQLGQQRAREAGGEDIGEEGERDLDDEVPDMDAEEEIEDEEGGEDEEEHDLDLDGDIPEGDSGWAYDTTRDLDTGSDEDERSPALTRSNLPQQRGATRVPNSFNDGDIGRVDRATYESSMLDEDELDDYDQRDLDDDIPETDTANLDDDVPEGDDGGWEHTDTELEESDMDISIMPPGVTAHLTSILPPSSNMPRQRHNLARQSNMSQLSDASATSSLRRTSGNIPLPMAPPPQPTQPRTGRQVLAASSQPHFTPDYVGSEFSVSNLISTGNTDMSSEHPEPIQRAWLDPASARRNLFGASRGQPQAAGGDPMRIPARQPVRSLGVVSNSGRPRDTGGVEEPRQVSSGGLFTPVSDVQRGQHYINEVEQPVSRTRSGRVIGGNRGGRRAL